MRVLLLGLSLEEHTVANLALSMLYESLSASDRDWVTFYDEQVHTHKLNGFFDYVCMSLPATDYAVIHFYTQVAKRRAPFAKLVIGGSGVTQAMLPLLQKRFPEVLFHVGDGRALLKSLVRCQRHRDEIVPVTLDKVIRFSAYTDEELQYRLHRVSLLTTRGCPYHCTYCGASKCATFTVRDPQIVLSEIRNLHRRGVRRIDFGDSNFFRSPYWREYVAELKRLGMIFGCITDLRSPRIVSHLMHAADAGMYYCIYGLETLKAASLRACNKHLCATDARRHIKSIAQWRRYVLRRQYHHSAFLIGGLPYQTKDDVLRDVEFCFNNGIEYPILTVLHRFDWEDQAPDGLSHRADMTFNEQGTLVKTRWMSESDVDMIRELSRLLQYKEMQQELRVWYKTMPG